MNRKTVIFDSSGLTALLNEADAFHSQALSISDILTDQAVWQVILPAEIFAETVTTLSKRVDRRAGANAAEEILQRVAIGDFVLSEAAYPVYQSAIGLLRHAKGSQGAPSFFDCLVMAFAKHFQTPYIFGYDEVFRKNGYKLITQESTQEAA